MQYKQGLIVGITILNCLLLTPAQAADATAAKTAVPEAKIQPKDPQYCTMLNQLHAGMDISDVFLLLGPPHSFGQPPNLDLGAVTNPGTKIMTPQSNVNDTEAARARIKASMATDPILGAFINAPKDYHNVLIWQFENNSLNVAVKVTGPTVSDVSANFNC